MKSAIAASKSFRASDTVFGTTFFTLTGFHGAHVTGGVIFNDNKYDANGTPNGIPGSFSASVKGNSAAPYLGVGWGRVAGMGINWYADLGAMFMGSPKATINANCGGLSAAQCTTLQNQAATEQSALQDKINSFKIYPVLSIGFTVGF